MVFALQKVWLYLGTIDTGPQGGIGSDNPGFERDRERGRLRLGRGLGARERGRLGLGSLVPRLCLGTSD
jgi:hypothetical protein